MDYVMEHAHEIQNCHAIWEATASSSELVAQNEEEGKAANRDINHSCLATNFKLATGMLTWH